MATANSPYLWHKGTNLSSFCMKETVPHRPWYQPITQPCHLAFAVVEKSPRSTWHYNPFGAINNASITSKALIVLIEVINLNILDSFPGMMNKLCEIHFRINDLCANHLFSSACNAIPYFRWYLRKRLIHHTTEMQVTKTHDQLYVRLDANNDIVTKYGEGVLH